MYCYASSYAIYALIVISILPLVLMIVFSLLAWHNLRIIRSRIVPMSQTTRNINIHKFDRDLMKMLSGEVFLYCLTTIPYPIDLIYNVSTSSIVAYKSPTRLATELLIGYIISPLLNLMYCCTQFYVYALCSGIFRKELLNVIRMRSVGICVTDVMTKSMTQSR